MRYSPINGRVNDRRSDRLIRLQDDTPSLSKAECESVTRRIFGFAHGGGETRVKILSWWNGELRWARNRVSLASDRRDIRVLIDRSPMDRGKGSAETNQLDDVSLEAAVRAAERAALVYGGRVRENVAPPPIPHPERLTTAIWSETISSLTTEARGTLARTLMAPAEAKGMLSAGYLEVRSGSLAELSSKRPEGPYAPWDIPYTPWTQAQLSMTVRDQLGAGSGWAGLSSYDWRRIDAEALAARALEKCLASQHPVGLEPGRYTVILEPQAVADLLELVADSLFARELIEKSPRGLWSLGYDTALKLYHSKLGLKVMDERITISHEPADPELGILPRPWMQPVTWVDHGVLTNLVYDRPYALGQLHENAAVRGMTGYRMSGGETSIDEMIRTTKRGLLVTRFSDIHELDRGSLLATGVTRDGLWLIEHGKISKAVKNFRFTESPLFVLNSVEQLGPPVPVFRPVKKPDSGFDRGTPVLTPAIVPPVKARDFSFTSTIDAI